MKVFKNESFKVTALKQLAGKRNKQLKDKRKENN